MRKPSKEAGLVFLSSCSPRTEFEENLRSLASKTLANLGWGVIDSVNIPSQEYILDRVIESTQKADAVISIAFTRNLINISDVEQVYATSPWIHIESALAYSMNKPLLIIGDIKLCQIGALDIQSMACERLFIDRLAIDEELTAYITKGISEFLKKD